MDSEIFVKKFENLLKINNIKKLIQSKKLNIAKTKANKTLKTGFFTYANKIIFT